MIISQGAWLHSHQRRSHRGTYADIAVIYYLRMDGWVIQQFSKWSGINV